MIGLRQRIGQSVTSCSSIQIEPALGRKSPTSSLARVDLPQPAGKSLLTGLQFGELTDTSRRIYGIPAKVHMTFFL
jgi:hypothetical protein